MKRIVNGVTYNTETSTALGKKAWEGDGSQGEEVLYQTQGGALFVHEQETRLIWNEREQERQECVEHRFIPMSAEEAQHWIMTGETEIFHNPFDDPPEAAAEAEAGATIYIRVPVSLKRRVDEAAKGTKVSGNVWAMRCVERCLQNPAAKQGLATALDILQTLEARNISTRLFTRQVDRLLQEAREQIQAAWVELGFDDKSEDLGARIMAHVGLPTRARLRRTYPLYKGE